MIEKLSHKIKKLRSRPVLVILKKIVEKITLRLVQLNYFYLMRYNGIPENMQIRGRGGVREGTIDDIADMSSLNDKRDTFAERFRINDFCLVAVVDGNIVGYEWFCDKSSHLEGRYHYRIDIPGNAIYAYDAYILPEYRLSGLWLKFKYHLTAMMNNHGKNEIITLIDYGNNPSMNTHTRFGFAKYKSILAISIFGLKYFKEMR